MKLILLALLLMPDLASAQEAPSLRRATIAASVAAAADWASTYHALSSQPDHLRERNPFLRPFQAQPGPMVVLGAAMDVGGLAAWNLTVGRTHPKLATVGLYAMAGLRTYWAVRNLRNAQIAGRLE
jgi:hypothetical protein